MLFNSLHFILFLPVVILLFYLTPGKYRWLLLLGASCYFYMAFVPAYILILFFIILLDYWVGIKLENTKNQKTRKLILTLSLIANISLLAFFKYFNFLNDNITALLDLFHIQNKISFLNIVLPIGLSFHTFQSMGYTIDVYYNKQKAERHIGYYSLYVLFFPQMVAGPIERYERLGNQLREISKKYLTYNNVSNGLRLILYGLFIKMTIADNLADFVNTIYDDPLKYNSLSVVTGLIFYSFQIYSDFYGYSLIALGSARLMGINLMDNFKNPYLAKSISEFWSRWHISLSTWFRDYLFIPLGGSRVRFARWFFNIMVVFSVSGLWHGASWAFVIWGALHGLTYMIERWIKNLFHFKEKDSFNFWGIIDVLKNFVIVTIIWIFFRGKDMSNIGDIFHSVFNNFSKVDDFHVPAKIWVLFSFFILSDIILFNNRYDKWCESKPIYIRWVTYSLLIFAILALSGVNNNPFIYFQF